MNSSKTKEKQKKVAVIVPTYNEEGGISKVIGELRETFLINNDYHATLIVVDNGSTDRTVKEIKKMGVTPLIEPNKGKGYALKTGFSAALSEGSDYIIIIDGDATYKSVEIPRLLEPLESDFCDVIAGSRISGKTINQSLTFSHRFGNWLYSFLVRHFYKANITDTLTGFIAFKAPVIKELLPHLTANDFTIEMDMITKIVRLGYEIYSVPITYDARIGVSKLNTWKDGIKILLIFLKNLAWNPQIPSLFCILKNVCIPVIGKRSS